MNQSALNDHAETLKTLLMNLIHVVNGCGEIDIDFRINNVIINDNELGDWVIHVSKQTPLENQEQLVIKSDVEDAKIVKDYKPKKKRTRKKNVAE